MVRSVSKWPSAPQQLLEYWYHIYNHLNVPKPHTNWESFLAFITSKIFLLHLLSKPMMNMLVNLLVIQDSFLP